MSNEKPSNPHAFPVAGKVEFPDRVISVVQEGMTLRDWFAGQALAGILANPGTSGITQAPDISALGAIAFRVADAMLKAREET